MTALLNFFYRVDVNVLMYEAGTTTTKTYSFVNKALKDSTSITTYWPILQSIGEYSVSEGETLPNIDLSAVTIDNRIGTFGANRKFSDVLQRYTPTEQTIVLYMGIVSTGSDTVSSWEQIGQGVISNWEATPSEGAGSLTFQIRAKRYAETILTLEVSRSIVGMENAPLSSLGRTVPLLLGTSLDVIPIRITADGAALPRYATGTCLFQHLHNRTTFASVYSKNDDDEWEEAVDDFSDLTASSSGQYTLNTYAGRAFGLTPNGSSAIVGGIKLAMKGNGLASSTARLSVFILRYNSTTYQVIEEVAKGTVDLAQYDAQNAISTNPIYVNVSFDKVVFLSAANTYAVGWSVTGYQIGDMSIHHTNAVGSVEFRRDATDTASSSGFEWKLASTSANVLRAVPRTYSAVYDDDGLGLSQTGLGFSTLQFNISPSPDSGQSDPIFDNFPILIGDVIGLSDYGTLALIEKPQDIIAALSYQYSPSGGWTDSSSWDTTTLSSSHYAYLFNGASANLRSRVVRGVFDRKVTFSQVVSEICRCTASKVGVLSTGKSFLYPFGMTVSPARDIPASDITALTWQQQDVSTVVNRAVIKVGRSNLYSARSFETDEPTGYQYVTDFSAGNYPQVAAMTQESRAIFGQKDLENGDFALWPYPSGGSGTYLCDSTGDGSILAEYYIGRFGKPITQCSFIVPYQRYSDLRMFDVITFTSVEFPSFYGTDPNARDGTVDVGGAVSTVTTADSGFETVRAQTYRGLITGRSIVLAMEHAPVIRFTVQVLLNYPFDPT